jgi:hypothetical protein
VYDCLCGYIQKLKENKNPSRQDGYLDFKLVASIQFGEFLQIVLKKIEFTFEKQNFPKFSVYLKIKKAKFFIKFN